MVIQYRISGNQRKIVDGIFMLCAAVCDDCRQRCLAPVPAVVSTAMSRGNFLQMRSNPFILWIGLLGFTIQAPVTLAQSMAEPPPKAMIAFVPAFQIQCPGFFNISNGRVRHHLVINRTANAPWNALQYIFCNESILFSFFVFFFPL